MARDEFKNYDLLKAQITEMMEGLIEELELGWIDIDLAFDTAAMEDGTVAETNVLPEYRESRVLFHLRHCATRTMEYLEATAVHELCHIAMADMEQLVRDGRKDAVLREKQCERAVENVARMIIAARKKRG